MNPMTRFTIKAAAKGAARRFMLFTFAKSVVMTSFCFLLVSYSVTQYVNKAGNFTILVPQSYAITLCDDESFENPTTHLEADELPTMTNITKSWLPEFGEDRGPHNGDNYIAYTFFIKNVSGGTINYLAEISIKSVSMNVDEATRIMVIKNGEERVFAKQSASGEPEPDTLPFASTSNVYSEINENFAADAMDKYTVVIWLEGNDPECVDDIIGGHMTMIMSFSVGNG